MSHYSCCRFLRLSLLLATTLKLVVIRPSLVIESYNKLALVIEYVNKEAYLLYEYITDFGLTMFKNCISIQLVSFHPVLDFIH